MKIKRCIAFMLSVTLFACAFAGCAKKDEPQAVVREFFGDIEKSNWNSLDLLCDESVFSTAFFSSSRNVSRLLIDNKKLLPEIMKKTKLEAAGNSIVNGNTATVKIRVSAYDLPDVLSDYMLMVMMSGQNQLDIEKIFPALLENVKTVESEITVTLNKQDDGTWKIHTTDELADAISGGLATASVSDKSEDATEDNVETLTESTTAAEKS